MNECLTWASVSDRAAVGEAITAEERLFLRSHPHGCRLCASEDDLWGALSRALEEPEGLTRRPRDVRPVSLHPLRRLAGRTSPRARQLLGAAAFLMAAAAAAALLTRSNDEPGGVRALGSLNGRARALAAAKKPGGAQLALTAGDVRLNQSTATAGERLAVGAVITVTSGEACVLIPPGVSVCLEQGTELSVESLEPDTRRFRLRRGHAVAHLDPQPAGSSFGFETPAGSVVAKGTVFSLRTDGASVTLRVHEGVVLNSQSTATSAYEAPSTVRLSREHAATHEVNEATSDARLMALARHFTDGMPASLLVTAAFGSSVTLDDLNLGMAPISALVPSGDHRMEVSRAGFAPIVEHLTFEPGARLARAYDATAELGVASTSRAARSARQAATETPAALLKQARALRGQGQYKDADNVFRRLLRDYAGSAEARVALVSLGDLQLSQLGDASAALRSFDSYLRGGGALQQEASYGRIRALQRLGRSSEARAASDAFMRAYPNSVQAATLRRGRP